MPSSGRFTHEKRGGTRYARGLSVSRDRYGGVRKMSLGFDLQTILNFIHWNIKVRVKFYNFVL